MEKKTLEQRYKDETLTDNTKLSKYRQCKDCFFRDDGTVYTNDYRKCCCVMYPYPSHKPMGIMKNTETCEYYVKE